jgi:hypothetical protein
MRDWRGNEFSLEQLRSMIEQLCESTFVLGSWQRTAWVSSLAIACALLSIFARVVEHEDFP